MATIITGRQVIGQKPDASVIACGGGDVVSSIDCTAFLPLWLPVIASFSISAVLSLL
jgi:hypothetical protein